MTLIYGHVTVGICTPQTAFIFRHCGKLVF